MNIVHETTSHYVTKKETGWYEVYRQDLTHAVRVATIHYSNAPDKAFGLAVDKCRILSGEFVA